MLLSPAPHAEADGLACQHDGPERHLTLVSPAPLAEAAAPSRLATTAGRPACSSDHLQQPPGSPPPLLPPLPPPRPHPTPPPGSPTLPQHDAPGSRASALPESPVAPRPKPPPPPHRRLPAPRRAFACQRDSRASQRDGPGRQRDGPGRRHDGPERCRSRAGRDAAGPFWRKFARTGHTLTCAQGAPGRTQARAPRRSFRWA